MVNLTTFKGEFMTEQQADELVKQAKEQTELLKIIITKLEDIKSDIYFNSN